MKSPASFLALFMLSGACTLEATTVFVYRNSHWPIQDWKYFTATREASSPRGSWREMGFDDSAWPIAKTPFAFGTYSELADRSTKLSGMQHRATSLYLRTAFFVEDPSRVSALKLQVRYPDGFIAWINGTRVASANAPSKEAFDAVAGTSHAAASYETFELAAAGQYLKKGDNVLAIQAFTSSKEKDGFLIDAGLVNTVSLAFNKQVVTSSDSHLD